MLSKTASPNRDPRPREIPRCFRPQPSDPGAQVSTPSRNLAPEVPATPTYKIWGSNLQIENYLRKYGANVVRRPLADAPRGADFDPSHPLTR